MLKGKGGIAMLSVNCNQLMTKQKFQEKISEIFSFKKSKEKKGELEKQQLIAKIVSKKIGAKRA